METSRQRQVILKYEWYKTVDIRYYSNDFIWASDKPADSSNFCISLKEKFWIKFISFSFVSGGNSSKNSGFGTGPDASYKKKIEEPQIKQKYIFEWFENFLKWKFLWEIVSQKTTSTCKV